MRNSQNLNVLAAAMLGAATLGAAISVSQAETAAGTQAEIAAFSAHYDAYWKSITVGTSDLQLQRGAEPDHYVYTWIISAHGIFRIIYSNPVTQKSWLKVDGEHIRALKYHGDDGSSSVDLDFDWDTGHARGKSEGKPVDLALSEGTQDVMSIQLEIMLDLKRGNLPAHFRIIDNDEVKDFNYTNEGTARIHTALGDLDTIVVASQRTGNSRILRMWFAPSLGYIPVKAERWRDGKLEFAMRIKALQR
ncbi:MAG TPA: DUF3108 domain-containing protein [Steroidobacteraceae bacterium]|nr:DUF3108 domain-containing protein [Steroidobacteraceae bacterium]